MPLSGSFTQSYTRTLLDAISGRNLLDSPTKLQLGLFTSDPGEEPDTWQEVSGNGYSRVNLDLSLATSASPVPLTSLSQVVVNDYYIFTGDDEPAHNGDIGLLLEVTASWPDPDRVKCVRASGTFFITPIANISFPGSGSGSITNESTVTFPAATAEWTGVKFGGLISTSELTLAVEQPGATDSSGNPVQQLLSIPTSHAKVLSSDVEITGLAPGSSVRHVKISAPVASWNSGSYGASDIYGTPHHFIRIKSGSYAGMCLMASGDEANEIEVWANWSLPQELVGQHFDICENPTLEEFFGEVTTGESATAGGILIGSSSSLADSIYIEKFGLANQWNIFYCQDAPSFAGGTGWRRTGSAMSDASTARIPVGNLSIPQAQEGTSFDSAVFIKGREDVRNGVDWTVTSQLHLPLSDSDRDASLLARLRFEDSSGNPINSGNGVNVTSNNQLEIAVGDLVLSLD